VAAVAAVLAAQALPRRLRTTALELFGRRPAVAQAVLLAAALTAIDVLGPPGVAPFLYFRF
jgi:hypothetical protein